MARDGSWTGELTRGIGTNDGTFNPSAYSAADIAAIVEHADSLFIDVMFELDTPVRITIASLCGLIWTSIVVGAAIWLTFGLTSMVLGAYDVVGPQSP